MLDDLKIIELGQGVAPAFCAKLFAGLGAEVIKIEPPGGDVLRTRGPFAGDEPGLERSGLFAYVNMSKLGVTLDIGSERGRALFLDLARNADILIENNAPAWMAAHGLDYERLHAIAPALIVTSITAFGQDGPWRDYAANDFIVQHAGGIAYSNGVRARDPEAEPPIVIPGYASEFAGGLAAAAGTMCALFVRDATGEGEHVDVALQEVLAMHLQVDCARVTYAGEVPRRDASAQPPIPYVGQQPVADGYVDFVVRTEEHWRRFVAVLGNPEWANNELFATMASRSQYWDALEPLIQQETKHFGKEDLFRKSQANGVSAAAVYTVEDAARSGHFADRGCFVEHEHPAIGRMRTPGPPVRLAGEQQAVRRPAPRLGEHNNEVFARLGLSDADVASLRAEGIV
jgi:crotonobetainyl-CoA:carnitine CoA-transferase CaiB-like acyl-CoA transferase